MRRTVLLILAVLAAGQAALVAARRDGPAIEPPTTVIDRAGCVTSDCHPGIKESAFLHGPVFVNACDSCHRLTVPETHTFEFTRGRRETCSFCHVVEAPEGEHIHAPYAQGECLSCHDPHGGPLKSLLRGKRYGESCDNCHSAVTGAKELVHGPAAAGACGACHRPHSSAYPMLLTGQGRDLCLRCHASTGVEIDSMHFVHSPSREDCRMCHDPHESSERGILKSDPVALCTGCHQDIAHTIDNSSRQHDAVTKDRSCLNCHAAHASNHPVLMKNRASALCFECHDREIEMPDGTRLANIKEIIETGTSLHGPVSQHDCTACHDIHGGDHSRLLTREYPSAIYYPYDDNAYALCFSCHDRRLVLEERDDTVTSFRNGDMNLHYVHVHKDAKGRSCKVCHDAHASTRENHIRDSIPFGPAGWELPIGFQATMHGGTCQSGCHSPYQYDRVNPVVYPAKQPDESWRGIDLVPGEKPKND